VRTFIVRLLGEPGGGGQRGPAAPRLRGVVDEVASGLRTTFGTGQELLAALTAAAAEPEAPRGGQNGTAREPASDYPDRSLGED
jgi:hypothetical protein